MKRKRKNIVDDAEFSGFHARLTVYSSGGPFLDGYILSIIAIALIQIRPQLHLNTTWSGLIGASALIGIFIGGFMGYVTDKFGRQLMYTIDFIVLIVASILQFWVQTGWQLFIIRLILGISVGADYPIATSLLAEFSPKKERGLMLGVTLIAYYIGSTVAYIVGQVMLNIGPDAWRWILASSAIPAIILVLLRMGTPESPRWLLQKGRKSEAEQVLKQVYGPTASLEDIVTPDGSTGKTSYLSLFMPGYLKRTLYVGLFYMAAVAPLFAMLTFGPEMLTSYHLFTGASGYGAAIISALFLIGCIPALFLVNRMGRRMLIIVSFVGMTVGVLILGLFPHGPLTMIFVGFVLYAIFSGGPNVMEWLAPNELFPTEVRGTAVGITTCISRFGAVIGTYLFPWGLENFGVGPTMLVASAVTFGGLIVCVLLAPETTNKSLNAASQLKSTSRRKSPAP
ncbi:MFS transporter [Alicyclobacillus fastidiosus]|uniref:MFS transporter n=1 Tax=Alicyclobacillus fastidiosus TaxID=392011 RepID=A0ABV5AHZ6_9BACL|nr:MFS transporter [Alicyclobacillus fastidiosus]WEH11589.1 MFS transporter [Alicyclobacillus fastidiosus]